MEEVFNKKVEEKEERMKRCEEEERERMEREQEVIEREREEVERRREELVREREEWEARTREHISLVPLRSSSSSSLSGRKKHLSLNILPFRIGRS